ncbi:MAG TPA: hypothetical protein VMU51_08865 [Mycobacteriales bacterium]|nr:hypothetical protein [Mycobacteriales bacterium]
MTTTQNHPVTEPAAPATTDLAALQRLPEPDARDDAMDPTCGTSGVTLRPADEPADESLADSAADSVADRDCEPSENS